MIVITAAMPRAWQQLEGEQAAGLAEMFRLMGDGTRLRIILACVDEATHVGALARRLSLSPSLVSHHLRLLRAGRILRAERRGKQVFYSLADDHIRRVIGDMIAHVGEPEAPELVET